MRNAIVIGGSIVLTTFVSVSAAGDDERYPAYHFEPKVIVPAPEAAAKEESLQPDPRYPAYRFEPKVIVPAKEESPQPDPRHPAYHFEPKVIYQDKEAIGELK